MTVTVQKTETVTIKSSSDVVMVRQRVRVWTIEMKFSLVEQTKIVTAASELGRNTLEHGGGGIGRAGLAGERGAAGVAATLFGPGPGHPDIAGIERRIYHRVGGWAWGWVAASV